MNYSREKKIPDNISCSTVCFRDRNLAEALDKIESMGFKSVDLAALAGLCEHIPPHADKGKLKEASHALKNSSLRVVSINADIGSFNSNLPSGVIFQRIELLSEFASEHNIPLIVLTCGDKEQTNVSIEQQISLVANGLNQCYEIARKNGTEVAVETPHYFRLVNTPERVESLGRLLSPEIKFIFDTSHIRAPGQNVSERFEELAGRVKLIHLRDAIDNDIRRVIGGGDIDFKEFIRKAKLHGYEGDYVLELETHDSPFSTKDEEVSDAVIRLSPLF